MLARGIAMQRVVQDCAAIAGVEVVNEQIFVHRNKSQTGQRQWRFPHRIRSPPLVKSRSA